MPPDEPRDAAPGSSAREPGDTGRDGPSTPTGASAATSAARPGSGRIGLDRTRVLRAAVEYIDRHGLQALTMRRLGAELGVEAMALYRYVPGREDLLDGVVEEVVNELYGDPDVHLGAEHGWQDYLQRLAHGVRRIALTHPQVFPLVATRPPAAPWVRPPLRSLRWVESFLAVLGEAGFPDDTAVAAYRAYTSFLLGHLLLEVSQRGAPITSEDEPEGPAPGTAAPQVDLGRYPRLLRLAPLLQEDESTTEFEEALENLLERLDLLLRLSSD